MRQLSQNKSLKMYFVWTLQKNLMFEGRLFLSFSQYPSIVMHFVSGFAQQKSGARTWEIMFNLRCIQKIIQYLKFLIFLLIENSFSIFSRPKKSFAGEIVLITGSANGIGRQVALKLAPLGVTLVLWDIDDEGNKETSRLAQENGASTVFVYHCDCSSRDDVYEQADKVRSAFFLLFNRLSYWIYFFRNHTIP